MQQKDEIKSISIIGSGNVGWHLANAFHQSAYTIKHIISRNLEDAATLGVAVDAEVLTETSQVKDEPDLYLICVQDSEIEVLAKSLSASKSIVAHTSGGTDLGVFMDKPDKYGVFYPLQTFTRGHKIDYSRLPFLLEASDQDTLIALQGLAEKISGNHHIMDSRSRLKVHLAAVFACNFSNHMAAIADKLLKETGLDFKIIQPLMDQSMKKLESMSPGDAQTGPASRKDEFTMRKHLELLSSEPELLELYKQISQNIDKEKDNKNNE